jgi:hypothetical protein
MRRGLDGNPIRRHSRDRCENSALNESNALARLLSTAVDIFAAMLPSLKAPGIRAKRSTPMQL